MHKIRNPIYFLLLIVIFSATLLPVSEAAADDVQSQVSQINQQIQQLQSQIAQYQQQIDTIHGQALTLQGEVNSLNAQIKQITLEVQSLNLSIENTNLEISGIESQITADENSIAQNQAILGQYLRVAYQNDQESLTNILLKNNTLSDFFNDLNSISTVQDNLRISIDNIKSSEDNLKTQKSDLEAKEQDLEQQQGLVLVEKRGLDQAKAQKANILAQTQGQESKFQQLVTQNKQNIAALEQEIYYLEQNGVSVEDAIKYGNLAAIAAGIRPAFLLAELEVESGLGENVGKCNRATDPPNKHYQAIMAPNRDIPPFLQITSELGLDPNTTPVSCPQFINGKQYGWGGAMGPAQFIPSTWMGYRDRVSQIVGHPANPWNIEDAFTAAAVKLAAGGATSQTTAGEVAASKAYYSGNPKCSSAPCNSYANAVQRTAAQIAQNL